VAFVIGEAVVGFFSNSLALLSDAGHNFADALALVLSWYSLWIAQRPSSCVMKIAKRHEAHDHPH